MYNERQKVELGLEKTMELNEEFGIGSNNELANVTFGLYAAEDLTAEDGSVIPVGGLLEVVSVDAEGRGIAQTDLPFGSYYPPRIPARGISESYRRYGARRSPRYR